VRRFFVTAAILLASHLARAQPVQDKAVAAQLFDDADALMAAGKFADACPKYAESERLDPQLGTLLHLAECLERAGKTASAWATFKDANEIAAQRSDPRAPKIRARLAELEPRLPRLTINVSAAAPADLEVKRDGGLVGKPVWGASVPVDPGDHIVSASAAGRAPFTQDATVVAGRTTSIDIPDLPVAALGSEPAPAPMPGAAVAGEVPISHAPTASPSSASSPGSTQRILGWTAVGAGAVGIAIGIAFELKRSSKLSDRDGICPSGVDCEPGTRTRIQNLEQQARSAQTIGAIGLIAGGVLAAAGVTLLLTAPHGEERPRSVALIPAISRTSQGLMISGRL
jgi:hypothetical protein